MKRLEELFTEMTREIPFVINEELKPYILELAQIYAREVAQASLEKAAEEVSRNYNDSYECKQDILNPNNITLL
ncbi:hypothetical protein I6H88_13750 [Elizabethkingia bruuniana]|uniref:Uncharacterized protein n=1 Tax=Elizabethkingia bruuniana TaxID=1756149 RepID=A0A7T7ZWM6_9FLAO|nr:hypothetical protein [Elizabethkingia bruuniana]KGO08554.1 hypothetical protein KS04_18375 [Elizabethkingia miricola]AQX84016.1 hypothetical protein AYC65_02825 [Elizabethkingia bruuniana]OPB64436.1 hypothetical protein BAY12_06465 [Elizabethkingia bruuniana]QDZ63255.1 hypothetical protein EVD20_12250 [Elizabethkingia bruuniana]QQN57508.1 hypothetical protein I6H88_13750 [Elizabethkingia bruuniana]